MSFDRGLDWREPQPVMRLILGSVLAGIVSIGVIRFRARFYPEEEDRGRDPPIVLSSTKNNNNNHQHRNQNHPHCWKAYDVFSREYEEARTKFRSAVRNLDDDAEHFALPVVDDLTIDVAILRGTGKGAMVHISGTHGVEGYAGSAIQLAFLDYWSEHRARDGPTIVLVHALNPFGMKHYRRVNENNVDLNRNAIDNFDEFIAKRDPNIGGYDTFRYFLSAEREPTIWDTTVGWWLEAAPKIAKNGFTQMKKALVAGQYHHPTGFSFGGTERQSSIDLIENFMQRQGFLLGEVVWIDVHSGLGKFGKDTLQFFLKSGPTRSSLCDSFPTAEYIVTPELEDKKAMSGYDLTRGIVLEYFQEKNPKGIFILQEFGTLPAVLVGRSLILENMVHQHGKDKSAGRLLLQKSFYPQSTEWRAAIVQRGISLILQAIELLKRDE